MNMYVWKYEDNKLDSSFNQDSFISFIGNKKKADEIWKKEKIKLGKLKDDKKIITEKIKNNLFLFFTNNITREDILDYIGKNSGILVLYYGDSTVSYPDILFTNLIFKHPEIINDKIVEKIAQDIDNCKHIKDKVFENKYFGTMMADNFSTGCKNLIVFYANDKYRIDLTRCGDNCAKWFTYIVKNKLKQKKCVEAVVKHCFRFTDDIFPIFSDYSKKILNNYEDFIIDFDNWENSK